MNQESSTLIEKINIIDSNIKDLEDERRKLLDTCQHWDTKLEYIETFSWDCQPCHVCVVCKHKLRDKIVPMEEALKLYKGYYRDLDIEVSEEEAERNCRGFNHL